MDENQTLIDCEVKFEGVGLIPFTASAEDLTEHGKQIWNELLEGVWGDIAPYEPTMEEPNPEKIIAQKRALIADFLDSKAREYGYDSINTAVTYADDPTVPKFQAEGIGFRVWRSRVWDFGYALINEVTLGQREIPTDEELLDLLPKLEINYTET